MISRLKLDRFGALRWQELRLEPTGGQDGACDCCGTTTRRVWGLVHHERGPVAAYFVGWTLGRSDHGAAFDLIVGPWGGSAVPADRGAVTLEYRLTDNGPRFGVVDAANRSIAKSNLIGHVFARTEVVGTPLAQHAFAVADAVLLCEGRLEEVRAWR